MSTMDEMVASERRVTIQNKRGLHARASAKFVTLASQFKTHVSVAKEGTTVGGTSIMGLMMLGAAPGDVILIHGVGEDAEAAVMALAALVERKFDECD